MRTRITVETVSPLTYSLSRGPSPYDVAKLLGDTVDTIEKFYASCIRELGERARRIIESGEGLELTCTQQKADKGRIQSEQRS